MEDCLLEAREELKRLEHIIYVSLKYTRTVDVLRNALKRLINIFDLIIEALLLKAVQEELITTLPKSPALRSTKLAELYSDDLELQKYLTFYLYVRNVLNQPGGKREEFRRHVTLVVPLENCTAEIDSDNLINFERFSHKFFHYAKDKVMGKAPED